MHSPVVAKYHSRGPRVAPEPIGSRDRLIHMQRLLRLTPSLPLVLLLLASCDASASNVESTVPMPLTESAPTALPSTPSIGTAQSPPSTQETSGASSTSVLRSGSRLAVGESARFELSTDCGVRVLGLINDVWWRASEGGGQLDWIPAEWAPPPGIIGEPIVVDLVLERNDVILATYHGRTVRYESGPPLRPEETCA